MSLSITHKKIELWTLNHYEKTNNSHNAQYSKLKTYCA